MQNLYKKSFLALNIICSLGLSALDTTTSTMPVHEETPATKTEKMVGAITSNLIAIGVIGLTTVCLNGLLSTNEKVVGHLASNASKIFIIAVRFGMAEASKRYINKRGLQSNALGLYILSNWAFHP